MKETEIERTTGHQDMTTEETDREASQTTETARKQIQETKNTKISYQV